MVGVINFDTCPLSLRTALVFMILIGVFVTSLADGIFSVFFEMDNLLVMGKVF